MWAYWPVNLFWKTFGVFPVSLDHRYRTPPLLFTVFLVASSPLLFYVIPTVACKVGVACTSESIRILKEIYPGVLNVTSTFSRVALLYCVRRKFHKYKRTLDSYETYAPTTAADARRYRLFTLAAVSLCLSLVVPVNAWRFRKFLAADQPDALVIVLYAYVMVQNLTMCCTETQFAEHCYALYDKLGTINGDIVKLRALLSDFSRYLCPFRADGPSVPAPLSSPYPYPSPSPSSPPPPPPPPPPVAVDMTAASGRSSRDDDNNDDDDDDTRSVANAIEALRIRHWLMREAIGCLNGLFGIQLGMSVCTLCIMSFFDFYYETFRVMGEHTLSTVFVYTQQLHFAVRYIGIILISHFTTKQALHTKTLIANLKSSYLDCSINKELNLFLDQLSHSSVELTACDIFTLNIRLITSTIAAGITYLVILVQYQSDEKENKS